MTYLYIAAGGGGDILAAAMLHAARGRSDTPAIATLAWDRLLIDPLPGPRGADAFDELRRITPRLFAVTSATRPIAPAGSTLPRLAAELDAEVLLLDPYRGGRGLRGQLLDAAEHCGAVTVTVVDVGGDIVARGDEAGLKSPTADLLSLAAAATLADQGLDPDVVVLGPGLDGELPAAYVRARIEALGGGRDLRLTARDAAPIASLLSWHPSEASGILAAAAAGARGAVEIRDAGTQIQLDEQSTAGYGIKAAALAEAGLLPGLLRSTEDFAHVEEVVRGVCGFCETDSERRKADALRSSPPPASRGPVDLHQRVLQVEQAAAERGSDYITLRRLAETAGAPRGGEPYAAWRADLIASRPHRYVPPIWAVHDGAAGTPAV